MSNVNINVSPYFDDYNELKNYHQILFKPNRAVQIRELNQLQTMLQKQVQRFGDHVFENGSMVIPGEFNFNTSYEYVTVAGVDYGSIAEILTTNEVSIVKNGTSKKAIIVQHTASTITDPVTFYLRYVDGNGTDTPGFDALDTFTLFTPAGLNIGSGTITSAGKGSVFDIVAGIFYINGNFVRSDTQRVILSKYTTTPSVVVGFRLTESVVTSTEDPTLFDNANGTTNFNAIGADRLKKELRLEVHPIDTTFDRKDFIEIAAFEEGELKKKARGPEYNVLAETLARRTYDESGDYTVNSFGLRLREHKDNGSNDGLFPDGDTSKFVVGVEPGKAYVKGFEVESLTTQYMETNKTRDTATDNNLGFIAPVGNFIVVSDSNKTLSAVTQDVIRFHAAGISSPGVSPTEFIGQARVKYVERAPSGQLIVYLFDIRSTTSTFPIPSTSFISNVNGVSCPAQSWTANLASPKIVQGALYSSSVFKLPVSNIKSISDISYTVRRSYTGLANASGTITFAAGVDELFALPSASSIYFGNVEGQGIREIASISTLSGTPVGKSLTVNFGAGGASRNVTVYTEVIKQNAKLKTKISTDFTITGSLSNRRLSLGRADVYKITAITESGVDRTSMFNVVSNSTQDVYGLSYIEIKPEQFDPNNTLGPITVTGKYFEHGAGDYFSEDSYQIAYEDIPTINQNNTILSLADCIDFRSRTDNTGTNFTGTGSSLTEVVSPFGRITLDAEYYLPRIDKVYVSNKGDFGIIKGVPSLIPKEPPTPDNAMALYRLNIPAYTKSVKEIQSEYINNKRYTMRDIGKLEDRITNLEYYTTLSLLESDTASLQILDGSGNNRFKNGFIVDNFVDHSVGSFTLSDYKCSIAANVKTLRPEFATDFANFEFDAAASLGVVKTGSLITLPYAEETYIAQLLASNTMNVNPYAVYNWIGTLSLIPSSDTWFDTRYTDPDVTYRVFNNGNLTQQWNSWSVNWTGESSTTQSVVDTDLSTTTTRTTTTTDVAVVNDREVNRNVIPFMRTRTVNFTGKGLMPFSRVYPFFDNVNVSAYCRPNGGSYGQALITNADGEVVGEFLIPNNDSVRFRTGTKLFTLIDNPDNNRVQSISTADAEYSASGALVTRTQSITATRNVNSTQSVVMKPVVIPPPPPPAPPPPPPPPGLPPVLPPIVLPPFIPPRVIFRDPLAQSFLVNKRGGIFLTSVELYFSRKDTSVPVTLEIRNMVNGYPGQAVVPYSVVLLTPSQVNVSNNGTVPTKFTFESPVFLSDGQEYCFVVLSNCNNYEAYIATMGENVIGANATISKQPYVGVMFKSQNSSTWTAEQLSDMKFKINIARFSAGVLGKAVFKSANLDKILLAQNPLFGQAGSTEIKVDITDHGLLVGSRFELANVSVTSGIPLNELNRVHTVVAVDSPNRVTISVTTAPMLTGFFGGAGIVSDKNIQMNTIQPLIQQLLFENTAISWDFKGVSSKSFNGTETPYMQSNSFQVSVNENLDLARPMMICNPADEAGRAFGKSGELTGYISSQSSNISPVIDVERVGLIGVYNKINNPSTLEESVQGNGNAYARYITKIFGLATTGRFVRAYADLSLPEGANVKIFSRVGNSEAEVEQTTWSEIPVINRIASPAEFVEHVFERSYSSTFTFYQFKIVMLSTSSSNVPRVQRFRGIVLGV